VDGDKKITLTEALEDISLGEIRIAEAYFGKVFGSDEPGREMTPMESSALAIFGRERRLRPQGGFTMKDTDKMSLKQVDGYFLAEPKEVDEDHPESAEGKDLPTAERTPESEPSSLAY
jgi:hypothetical protein